MKQTPANSARNTQGLRLRQERAFSKNALPLTIELACALKSVLRRPLIGLPPEWPYPDRVVAWLLPSLRNDVLAFHSAHGPGLVEILQSHQLQSLDRDLLVQLSRTANKLQPGVVELLSDIIDALQESNAD